MDNPGTRYCRFIDGVNRRALADLDQFLAGGVVQHAPEPAVGIDAARRVLAGAAARRRRPCASRVGPPGRGIAPSDGTPTCFWPARADYPPGRTQR